MCVFMWVGGGGKCMRVCIYVGEVYECLYLCGGGV